MLDYIISRQNRIAEADAPSLGLPGFTTYTICNLRGGIGKTSLAFNLGFLADDTLLVDTGPQCNLTWFCDNAYLKNASLTVYDALLPYFVAGLGKGARFARSIAATNMFFERKRSFYIPSDTQLYILPSQIATAFVQARTLAGHGSDQILDSMLYSLRDEIMREMADLELQRCLIDTSPYFSGATHLSWHASDALIIPVRTDQQSINSFSLLLKTLSDPAGEFRKVMPSDKHTPKIQLVVLTHCGWSTKPGARNKPNQQTRMYAQKALDMIRQNIQHFTTSEPTNHLLLLDDFLGMGRISSAKSKPVALLKKGDSMTINRVRTEVNGSVGKVQNQLNYINQSIWN